MTSAETPPTGTPKPKRNPNTSRRKGKRQLHGAAKAAHEKKQREDRRAKWLGNAFWAVVAIAVVAWALADDDGSSSDGTSYDDGVAVPTATVPGPAPRQSSKVAGGQLTISARNDTVDGTFRLPAELTAGAAVPVTMEGALTLGDDLQRESTVAIYATPEAGCPETAPTAEPNPFDAAPTDDVGGAELLAQGEFPAEGQFRFAARERPSIMSGDHRVCGYAAGTADELQPLFDQPLTVRRARAKPVAFDAPAGQLDPQIDHIKPGVYVARAADIDRGGPGALLKLTIAADPTPHLADVTFTDLPGARCKAMSDDELAAALTPAPALGAGGEALAPGAVPVTSTFAADVGLDLRLVAGAASDTELRGQAALSGALGCHGRVAFTARRVN